MPDLHNLALRLEPARNLGADTSVPGKGLFHVGSNIFWTDCGGVTIVLSMDSGKYFAFDNVAAFIWTLVRENTPLEEVARAVGNRYGVDLERATADVNAFVDRLRANGLIDAGKKSNISDQPKTNPRPPAVSHSHIHEEANSAKWGGRIPTLWRCLLFVEAYLLLGMTDMALRVIGFHGLWRRFDRNKKIAFIATLQSDDVKKLCVVALAAFRWYRPGAACMHRAAAMYWFLRRHGIPVALCLGVKSYPFASHVWIEFGDLVLADSPLIKDKFQTIARLA